MITNISLCAVLRRGTSGKKIFFSSPSFATILNLQTSTHLIKTKYSTFFALHDFMHHTHTDRHCALNKISLAPFFFTRARTPAAAATAKNSFSRQTVQTSSCKNVCYCSPASTLSRRHFPSKAGGCREEKKTNHCQQLKKKYPN